MYFLRVNFNEIRSFQTKQSAGVADCNEKTATMEISKTQAPHAHRSNVVRRVLKVLEAEKDM